jgi:hypothetical protein
MFNSSATIRQCFQAAVEEGERAIADAIQAAFELGCRRGTTMQLPTFCLPTFTTSCAHS